MGPGIEVVLLTKGQVLQRLREYRKVPGWRSEGKDPFSKDLHKLVSRLIEMRGGSLKIDAVSEELYSVQEFPTGFQGSVVIIQPQTLSTLWDLWISEY